MSMQNASPQSPRERVQAVSAQILAAFEKGDVPKALAQLYIRPAIDVPSRRWTLANRLIGLTRGHVYAAGFRQWQALGRRVRKGERAFHILGPRMVEATAEASRGEAEPDSKILVGFFTIPVFGYDQTEGDPLSGADAEPAFLDALPLVEVARSWGLEVEVMHPCDAPRFLGFYRRGAAIALAVRNLSTWAHELIHAADDRLGQLAGHGVEAEVVAELGGAVLLESLGYEHDSDRGGAFEYLTRHCQGSGRSLLGACTELLERTGKCVELVLAEGERVAASEALAGPAIPPAGHGKPQGEAPVAAR